MLLIHVYPRSLLRRYTYIYKNNMYLRRWKKKIVLLVYKRRLFVLIKLFETELAVYSNEWVEIGWTLTLISCILIPQGCLPRNLGAKDSYIHKISEEILINNSKVFK